MRRLCFVAVARTMRRVRSYFHRHFPGVRRVPKHELFLPASIDVLNLWDEAYKATSTQFLCNSGLGPGVLGRLLRDLVQSSTSSVTQREHQLRQVQISRRGASFSSGEQNELLIPNRNTRLDQTRFVVFIPTSQPHMQSFTPESQKVLHSEGK